MTAFFIMSAKLKPQLRISDQGSVFDPETGETFTLNETGLLIMKQLQSGASSEEVFQSLHEAFDLTRMAYDRMILDFFSVLKSYELLSDE